MEKDIAQASKVLAEYIGMKYIPFMEGSDIKPGWYKVFPRTVASDLLRKSGYKPLTDNLTGKYICRSHNDLRFYNSWDWLFDVISRLEKEDLSKYGYSWVDDEGVVQYNNGPIGVNIDTKYSYVEVQLELDPPYDLSYIKGNKREDVFWMLHEAVCKINEVKKDGKVEN